MNIKYRPVEIDDAQLLLNWSKEENVRKYSFSNHTPTFQEHLEWLRNKLNNTSCYFYICEVDSIPAGLVRFEKQDNLCVIGISIDKSFRGRGLSSVFLLGTIQNYRKANNKEVVRAYIKVDNKASVKAFEKAGFKFKSKSSVNNNPCLVYEIK